MFYAPFALGHTARLAYKSIGIVTQPNAVLGYEMAAGIAREALKTGKSVHDVAVTERGLLTR